MVPAAKAQRAPAAQRCVWGFRFLGETAHTAWNSMIMWYDAFLRYYPSIYPSRDDKNAETDSGIEAPGGLHYKVFRFYDEYLVFASYKIILAPSSQHLPHKYPTVASHLLTLWYHENSFETPPPCPSSKNSANLHFSGHPACFSGDAGSIWFSNINKPFAWRNLCFWAAKEIFATRQKVGFVERKLTCPVAARLTRFGSFITN